MKLSEYRTLLTLRIDNLQRQLEGYDKIMRASPSDHNIVWCMGEMGKLAASRQAYMHVLEDLEEGISE